MRNPLGFLMLLVLAALAVFVLLPVLGVLFVVVLVAIVLVPLLMRLPWFRDRIFIRRWPPEEPHGRPHPDQRATGDVDQGDVIDVEGRELPDKE